MIRFTAFCLAIAALSAGCATAPAYEPKFQSIERSATGGRLQVATGEQYRRETEHAPVQYNPVGRK